MTEAPSLIDLEAEASEGQELSRITVLVGELLIDVGVPDRAGVSAIVNDVIELINERIPLHGSKIEFDNPEGKWTLARLTGDAIDPHRSLAEADVHDGEILVVREARAPASSSLVDDLTGASATDGPRRSWFAEQRWTAGFFGMSVALSAGTVAMLVGSGSAAGCVAGVPLPALGVLVAGIGAALGAFVLRMRSGDSPTATWLAGMSLLLVFGGSLQVVPDARGVSALAIALALTAVVAVAQLVHSQHGRAIYATVIAVAVLGVPVALACALAHPNPRALGAVSASAAVVVVYLAPRIAIMVARLPVPRVPTAGEPLDDIETQGGTAVEGVNAVGKQVIPTEEGMADQVRRARDHLTGLVAAAATLAAVGCYQALDVGNGFFWQGTAFGFAVATVLCLRGRSHHDLVQSAVLIGGGLVIVLMVIVKTATRVPGWQVNAAVALVALTVLLVLCGLVAPRLEFSPVMRRRVEILEYAAIATVLPLACSITRLYGIFRELRV
ncbi:MULTISPECIES: type VII secretion integral membrane protein EccD [unclassified Mycobacterium]|uniref:type VII secretion integral membrane protein EccD n=1 Tax=unclassified Mycobacterium TaxID=2642494 RepID=UPI00080077F1|nr:MULTISPECIES: type VII secretion integral membrane protein EccD [unclassified Mycobacterium]OBG78663.1 type VII secretion integral membrane protein EccD [Mycobacterium sp. E1214]OBH24020.1 type VII secretion integral membrane protein EccD [Mycobacterium sp. E1319]